MGRYKRHFPVLKKMLNFYFILCKLGIDWIFLRWFCQTNFYILILFTFWHYEAYSQENQIIERNKHLKIIWLFMPLFLRCAFSCVSSAGSTVCRSNCIACRQKVSRQCVKACDTSNYWTGWKSTCTAYRQTTFLQCV